MSNMELLDSLKHETTESEPELQDLIKLAYGILLKKEYIPIEKSKSTKEPHPGNVWPRQKLMVLDNETDYITKNYNGPPEELLDLPLNAALQAEIEQLGKDVLDEAFDCFGEEGIRLLQEYKACEDEDFSEKISIIRKVLGLVRYMTAKSEIKFSKNDDDEGREDDRLYYPPIRISPKLMGQLPNPRVEPTCLGKSILMTSFFHKAGIPTLHGGLIQTHGESALLSQAQSLRQILKFSRDRDIDACGNYDDNMIQIHNHNLEAISKHIGFHTATYIKIDKERWIQLDPNYGSVLIPKNGSSALTKALEEISKDRDNQYIGSEKQVYLQNDAEVQFIKAQHKIAPHIPSGEEIEEVLLQTSTEEMYKKILEVIFAPLLKVAGPELPEEDEFADLQRRIKKFVGLIDQQPAEITMRERIQETIREFFVSTENPELKESFKRLKTDRHFRRRRVADLQLAPLITLLKLHSLFVASRDIATNGCGAGHIWTDVGHPEYRVGVSCLSDIAVYQGDKLPLSTWLTYWPSKVSLFEHLAQTDSPAQESLKKIALKYGLTGSEMLTNLSTVIILSDILKSTELGDQDDENQRGQADETA